MLLVTQSPTFFIETFFPHTLTVQLFALLHNVLVKARTL